MAVNPARGVLRSLRSLRPSVTAIPPPRWTVQVLLRKTFSFTALLHKCDVIDTSLVVYDRTTVSSRIRSRPSRRAAARAGGVPEGPADRGLVARDRGLGDDPGRQGADAGDR